jgi:hypothetical protein
MQVTTNNLEWLSIFPKHVIGNLKLSSSNFIVVRVIMVGVRGKRRGRSKDSDKETEGRDREEVEEEEEGSPGSCALLPHHYC